MTIKEKLDSIKGKKIAIWCEEEWMADVLFKKYGYNTNPYWHDDICYDLENKGFKYFMYEDKEYYEDEGYEIVSYKEFVSDTEDSDIIVLTRYDINAILDEKYGKDNWVIK